MATGPGPRRIFIAAASDLLEERGLAAEVVEQLRHEAGDRDAFDAYRWEVDLDRAWDAGKSYQTQIPRPSEEACEVLVCILGERAGSPLPRNFALPPGFECPPGVIFPCVDEDAAYADGAPEGDIPLTGTFFEFLDAWQAQQRHGRPHILVFVKGDASVGQVGAPADERLWGLERWYARLLAQTGNRKRLPQREDVEYRRQTTFLSRFFDRFLGNRGAVQFFADEAEFAEKLATSLRDALGLRRKSWRGNPYKHLSRYEVDESPVFFGRKSDTHKIVQRLSDADARRTEGRIPLLLLEGESGSGKSSVLRAGLAAALKTGRFASTTGAAFRGTVLLASDLHASDPFLALAEALAAPDVLPPLGAFAAQARARPIERRAERLLDEIARTLPHGDDDRRCQKLLLAIDQFDEVLRLETDESKDRWHGVLTALVALAQAGYGYTALALKSDATEILRRWLADFGLPNANAYVTYLLDERDLDLDDVIESPFHACGLTVGADLREHLTRQARQLRSLPLLSVALHNVYRAWDERRRQREDLQARDPFARMAPVPAVLNLADYEREADLGNAIDKLGEMAIAAASIDPERAGEELARLLRRLVSVPADSSAAAGVTLVSASPADVPGSARPLLDALKAHRLVVQEKADEVRLVHLAVLEHWSRANTWLEAERTHLRTRAEFERALPLWLDEPTDENAGRMWDRYIDAGERMLVAWRTEPLPADLRRFIVAAIRARFDRGSRATNDGVPRLVDAVRLDDEALATHMLDRRADPNAATPVLVEERPDGEPVRSGGSTPLMFAAEVGSERLLRLLIARGADVRRHNVQGGSALAYAARQGHDALVRLLLDEYGAGADPWVLPLAAFGGHRAVVDTLLAHGVDPDASDPTGWTALLTAAYAGHEDVIESLLGAPSPASIDKDMQGVTPLLVAAQQGHVDIVRRLLERGADPGRHSHDRRETPLMAAARSGHAEVVRRLLAANEASADARDAERRTALHLAVQNDRADVVAALLENPRLDRTPTDARWHTPLYFALARGAGPMIQLLSASGAGILPPWYGRDAQGAVVRLRGEPLRQRLEPGLVPSAASADDSRLPPPLLDGDWRELQASEAAALLTRAAEYAPDGLGCGVDTIASVRVRPLSCYRGARLCEARALNGSTPAGYLTFVDHPAGVTWLDGTSPPIHQLNAAHPLDVRTREQALEYLRFFCHAVHGERGAFRLVEPPGQLPWIRLHGGNDDSLRRCEALAQPIQMTWQEEGRRWAASGVLHHSRALFRVRFHLEPGGMVTMLDDQACADQLPLPMEIFSDGVRGLLVLNLAETPRVQFDLGAIVRPGGGDASTVWAAPPPLPGEWTVLGAAETEDVLRRAAADLPPRVSIAADCVDVVRATVLPFYDTSRLCEARVLRGGRPAGSLTFIEHPKGVWWLDGQSDVIHFFNTLAPLTLVDAEAAARYLRFYCAFVHGPAGAFTVLDSPDRLVWPAEVSNAHRTLVESLCGPTACERAADARTWAASAVIRYGAGVFRATFSITDPGGGEGGGRVPKPGKPDMLEDHPLAMNIGALVEAYEGGVRTLRRAADETR